MHDLVDPRCWSLVAKKDLRNAVAHLSHVSPAIIAMNHTPDTLIASLWIRSSGFCWVEQFRVSAMPSAKETLKVKDELLDRAIHAMAVGSGSHVGDSCVYAVLALLSCRIASV